MSASSSCAVCQHCVLGCLSRCLIRCSSLIRLTGDCWRPRSADDAGERDSALSMSCSLIRLGDERRWSHWWPPGRHWPDCLVLARSASCSVSSSSPEKRRSEIADSGTPAARCPNGIVRPSNTSRMEQREREVHAHTTTFRGQMDGRLPNPTESHTDAAAGFQAVSTRCDHLQPTELHSRMPRELGVLIEV